MILTGPFQLRLTCHDPTVFLLSILLDSKVWYGKQLLVEWAFYQKVELDVRMAGNKSTVF